MKKKGFTLIELLVVIAIIGLLSTLAVVALNSARLKARDAKRVSDIKQIQTALELYYSDENSYPTAGGGSYILGDDVTCLGSGGFGTACDAPVYMGLIPSDPTAARTYVYESQAELGGICSPPSPCPTYSITFELEGTTGGLDAGTHVASQDGIQ
ncbi:MAG: type II secretion system protein [Patescibacteria group bacterium]|nr:type II secretion system protein [Patescibacteria group bacterium]